VGKRRKTMMVRDLVNRLQMDFLPDDRVDVTDVVKLIKEAKK
jgi:hypothetical protein